MRTRTKQIAAGVGMTVLLTFLYVKTNSIDPVAHDNYRSSLHRIKDLDATIDKEILKSRYGLSTSYDLLMSDLQELKQLKQIAGTIPEFVSSSGKEEIGGRVREFYDLEVSKEKLIEHFKSRNAILNNSLRYFPVSVSKLSTKLAIEGASVNEVALLNDVLKGTLIYYVHAEPGTGEEITGQINVLRQYQREHPGSINSDELETTLLHADNILKFKPEIDDVIERIVAIPTTSGGEGLIELYDLNYNYAVTRANYFQLFLYFVSIVLLGYVGYFVIKQQKTKAELNRANETLEQRVAERAGQLVRANEALQIEVNERNLVEAERVAAREFLFAVIDNVPNLIFVKDVDGRYVLGNRALAEFCGTTVQELKGKTRGDFAGDPNETIGLTNVDIRLLDDLQEKLVLDETHTDANGTRRTYQTAKRSIQVGKDGSRFLVGVATDITERKHFELELRESKLFLNAVIDNVPNPIFVKDIKGNFVLANQAMADIFGTTTLEMIGKPEEAVSHDVEKARRSTEEDVIAVQNLEERFIPEEENTDADGNIHWFQTVKRTVALGAENERFLIGVSTDFTERKMMEGQLRNSQKLESIGQLAAGIAHEINTPTQYVGDNTRFIRDAFGDLSPLLEKFESFLESAQTGEITPELITELKKEIESADLEYLMEEVPNAIRQSLDGVSRIAKIVQSMKDFAHPGSRDKQAADLNRAIESTITVAHNEWKYIADLETNFDATLPLVPCFLGEFNQVILNMVINAAHAITDVVGDGSNGKGKITISTTRVNDNWAEVRIGDTGSGIPLEAQARIFDPFFTTKEVGKGTGQGLAISHTVVVDKHNGELTFETEHGSGTTFIIRLPLVEAPNISLSGN